MWEKEHAKRLMKSSIFALKKARAGSLLCVKPFGYFSSIDLFKIIIVSGNFRNHVRANYWIFF